jgi:ribose-phosphate pyrophosphokinase
VSKQDTAVVLPPDLARDEQMLADTTAVMDVAQSATPPQGASAKAGPERKRSGRLSEAKRFKIFCGDANKPLAEEVCRFVGVPLGETRMQRFADGEIHFQLL